MNPWLRAAQKLEKARAPKVEAEPVEKKRTDGKFVVARLGAPKGVEGALRIHSYSGESAHLLALKTVDLIHEGPGGRETHLRLKVKRSDEEGGNVSMIFEGHESPELAERLVGMEILVEREKGAQLRDNEWYIADLVGLQLVSPDGQIDYGTVHAICGGGPDPWLEVDRPDGSRALVPFRKEFIGDVDLPGNRLFLLSPWVLE